MLDCQFGWHISMDGMFFGWCTSMDGMFSSGQPWPAAWELKPGGHWCVEGHHLGPAGSSLAPSCQFWVYSAFLNEGVSVLMCPPLFSPYQPLPALTSNSHLISKTLGRPSGESAAVTLVHFCIKSSPCLRGVCDQSSIPSLIPTVPVCKDRE